MKWRPGWALQVDATFVMAPIAVTYSGSSSGMASALATRSRAAGLSTGVFGPGK